MQIIKNITYFILFISFCANLTAQPSSDQDVVLPKVFIIGEYEHMYENMVSVCNNHLLEVCDGSMDDAYNVWLTMLSEMEDYAKEKSFDINGIKMWLTAYWNEDGTIKHLVYYPKPNSRNMDFELLSEFLQEFAKIYTLPKESDKCFTHYASASFPTFAKMYLNTGKQ